MGNSSPLRKTIRDNDHEGMKEVLEDAGEGSPDIINEDFTADCLLQRSRNVQSPLHTCVARRKLEMTETLLQYGAEVNMGGRSGMTPLHYAAKNSQLEMCKLLVKYGADNKLQDVKGQMPIHSAAMSPVTEHQQQADALEFLISGDVGSPEDLNVKDDYGWTPLHVAASWGYAFIAKWLLEHGADKEVTDLRDRTPLDVAKGSQREKVIQLLTDQSL